MNPVYAVYQYGWRDSTGWRGALREWGDPTLPRTDRPVPGPGEGTTGRSARSSGHRRGYLARGCPGTTRSSR